MTSSYCSCHRAARTWLRWPPGLSNQAYLSAPHLEASSATTSRACSSPALTPVKPQPAPAILSQESVHTMLSITHHTRKRPSTGPRTTQVLKITISWFSPSPFPDIYSKELKFMWVSTSGGALPTLLGNFLKILFHKPPIFKVKGFIRTRPSRIQNCQDGRVTVVHHREVIDSYGGKSLTLFCIT
jgi:hypothetical protein